MSDRELDRPIGIETALVEHRRYIDRIDRTIVALLVERMCPQHDLDEVGGPIVGWVRGLI